MDVAPLAKLGELQSLQQLTLKLHGCLALPSNLQTHFSSLADFAEAVKSGAQRCISRARVPRSSSEDPQTSCILE